MTIYFATCPRCGERIATSRPQPSCGDCFEEEGNCSNCPVDRWADDWNEEADEALRLHELRGCPQDEA